MPITELKNIFHFQISSLLTPSLLVLYISLHFLFYLLLSLHSSSVSSSSSYLSISSYTFIFHSISSSSSYLFTCPSISTSHSMVGLQLLASPAWTSTLFFILVTKVQASNTHRKTDLIILRYTIISLVIGTCYPSGEGK